jgi:hypothetical protein
LRAFARLGQPALHQQFVEPDLHALRLANAADFSTHNHFQTAHRIWCKEYKGAPFLVF